MNLLLDTNALVWVADNNKSKNLGKQARHLIGSSDAVYFSSVSIVELRMKAMAGKLKMNLDAAWINILDSGLLELNLTAEHAEGIENFPSLVRHDPFDRMILAQAFSEHLTLLTADQSLLDLGLNYVIDARE